MRTDDLDYDLPPELIAQTPADRREAARLMVAGLGSDRVEHRRVAELPKLLRAGDLVVINDTRVLPARFHGVRERTGGRVEGLFLETRDDATWRVLLKARGRLEAGETIGLLRPGVAGEGGGDEAEHRLELVEPVGGGQWLARKVSDLDSRALLEAVGLMPLPPYIQRKGEAAAEMDELDRRRYQTVFAREPGAVAAPTAGLHLTEPLMDELRAGEIEIAKLTLHVGLGTFAPVRAEKLEDHAMHAERFTVPAETCVRALESLPDPLPPGDRGHASETRLLIQPPYRFRYADGLMTNFHLPRSTLLALVAAMTGLGRLKRLYATAIERGYRFYSYGDAMLILPE